MNKQQAGLILTVLGSILGATCLYGMWYIVDEGDRGVVLRYGAYQETAEPGFHFKLPLIDSVKTVSTRNQTVLYTNVAAYSKDQQPARLTISLTFTIPPSMVKDFYQKYGDIESVQDRLINRKVPTIAENVFGQYSAIHAVQHRAQLNKDLNTDMRESTSADPVNIVSYSLEGIDFSEAYEKSIEARMQAEVGIATQKQTLETEKVKAEITVTIAKADAESRLAKAKADAESIRMKGKAEAESITARGDALRQNPLIIDLTNSERWNGQLPTSMVPGGAVPFIKINPTTN